MRRLLRAMAAIAFAGSLPAETLELPEWDAAAATVVVYNPDFPESQALASYYATRRGIAADRVIGLKCVQTEAISRDGYDGQILAPLKKIFNERHWWQPASRMSILVLMQGMPSKIIRQHEKPRPSQEDEASVDSELCLLGAPTTRLTGALPNPYFGKKERFNTLANAQGMLLVCRLDAASPATVRRMIDDSIATEQTGLLGRAVIDLALKGGAYDEGDEWLRRAAHAYRSHGIPVLVDRKEPVLRENWPLPDTALYFGWYTGEIAGALKSTSFHFRPGAIACHLHSFSASVIRTTSQAWVGPILEHGAAATMGNVWEPYLSLTIHFDVLNERLLEGYTLAEAAWSATPGLSWQTVVLGDPLYRPFKHASMGTGIDRDYSLYKALVSKHADDSDSKGLKADLLKLALTRESPRLLELLALLSSLEGKTGEAVEILEHARSLKAAPADELRMILYEVELLRQNHEKSGQAEALALLKRTAEDSNLKEVSAFSLIAVLIREIGG
ncbi:MAG: hypothetical protein JWO94_3973 [Verrucomicrobiaceae bacterium]|nr:hypothetical protein [Verrucomicrobiaceae bacterium]